MRKDPAKFSRIRKNPNDFRKNPNDFRKNRIENLKKSGGIQENPVKSLQDRRNSGKI